jgi:hypothetical protein
MFWMDVPRHQFPRVQQNEDPQKIHAVVQESEVALQLRLFEDKTLRTFLI